MTDQPYLFAFARTHITADGSFFAFFPTWGFSLRLKATDRAAMFREAIDLLKLYGQNNPDDIRSTVKALEAEIETAAQPDLFGASA